MRKWVWVFGFLLILVAQGSRAAAPCFTMSPTSLNFGSQAVATVSPPKPISITIYPGPPNVIGGHVPMGPNASFSPITGPAYGDFFASDDNNCLHSTNTTARATTCHFTVTFNPSALGARTATLGFSNIYCLEGAVVGKPPSNPCCHYPTISLAGYGMPPIVVTPTSLAFGIQPAGTGGQGDVPRTITVKSNMPQGFNVNVTGITSTGPNRSDFSWFIPPGCSRMIHGEVCSIKVHFWPNTRGPKSATLTVNGIIGPSETPDMDWYGVKPPTPGPQPVSPPTPSSSQAPNPSSCYTIPSFPPIMPSPQTICLGDTSPQPSAPPAPPRPPPVFAPIPGRSQVPSPFPVAVPVSGTGR